MKPLPFAVLSLVLLLIAEPSPAADSALAGCGRIADVSLPYDVDVDTDALRFDRAGATIMITAGQVQAGERSFRDAAVLRYYDDLRGFLADAGSMANIARSFLRRGALPQAAADMCSAILAVHASVEALERMFPGFDSPVRVKLN